MDSKKFISELAGHEILLSVSNNKIQVTAPKGRMTAKYAQTIRDNKAALIEYLTGLNQQTADLVDLVPIESVVTKMGERIGLSHAQLSIWLTAKLSQQANEYNIPLAFEIVGEFNVDAAVSALNRLVQRHEILRTQYFEDDSGPWQVIAEKFQIPFEQIDLRNLNQKQKDVEISRQILVESAATFDLTKDIMLRGRWLQCSNSDGKDKGVLLLNIHHIATDGWSMSILFDEFLDLYRSEVHQLPSQLAPLPVQYADYARWQIDNVDQHFLKPGLTFWQTQLDGIPSIHSLPTDFPRGNPPVGKGLSMQLPPGLADKLKKVAQQQKVTPFMLLHAAFVVFLSRQSNSADVVIGTAVANRPQKVLANLIGFFVNSLALRVQLDDVQHASFSELLADVKQVNLEALANQQVPFDKVVQHCNVAKKQDHSPIFQIMLTMNNNKQSDISLADMHVRPLSTGQTGTKFDLTLNAELDVEDGCFNWSFDGNLFLSSTISTFHARLIRILEQVVELPDIPLSSLSLLSQQEMRFLTDDCNQTSTEYPTEVLIHELFEQQVALHLDKVALVCGDRKLTFSELNEKANRLARRLSNFNLETEEIVAICLPRSTNIVVSQLAILKAGGAFLVIDDEQPEARQKAILGQAKVRLLITSQGTFGGGQEDELVVHHITNFSEAARSKTSLSNPDPESRSRRLAYVIYTSGSTGVPKGVMIEHRSWVNLTFAMKSEILLSIPRIWALYSSFAFDGSHQGLSALLAGCTLLILQDEERKAPAKLFSALSRHSVDIMDLTPAVADMLLREKGAEQLPDLVIGGEAISQGLWLSLSDWSQKQGREA